MHIQPLICMRVAHADGYKGEFMKKWIVVFCVIASMLCVNGCKKENITIKADKISKQTVVLFEDGSMQSALNEKFSMDYYSLDELKDYITKDLESFNSKNGTSVKLNSATLKNGNVTAVFDYENSDDLNKYMEYDVTVLKGSAAEKSDQIPSKLNKFGKSSQKSKTKAIKSSYQALIIDNSNKTIKGSCDITVDGDIKFSKNVKKKDDNTAVISDLEGVAVIVFKP